MVHTCLLSNLQILLKLGELKHSQSHRFPHKQQYFFSFVHFKLVTLLIFSEPKPIILMIYEAILDMQVSGQDKSASYKHIQSDNTPPN